MTNPAHWLDANTFIEAKNRYYSFAVAPGFWQWLDSSAQSGIIYSPEAVRKELIKGNDDLSKWVKARKPPGLFVKPDEAVQKAYGLVANHVFSSYEQAKANFFLASADGWIIAHAIANSGIVVTHEALVGPDSYKVKIPNVCKYFNVQHANLFSITQNLALKLVLPSA